MEEEDSDNQELIFDTSKFVYGIEVVFLFGCAIAYIYLERFKNFEKFNIDNDSRDYLLKQLCIIQAVLLTYIFSFLAGFFGKGGFISNA